MTTSGVTARGADGMLVVRHLGDKRVVEVEQKCFERHRPTGSRTANSAPPPSTFDALIEPPWACAMA